MASLTQYGVSKAPYVNADLGSAPQLALATYGTLAGWDIANPNNNLIYVELFDAPNAAAVNLGTTPPKYIIPVEPSANVGVSSQVPLPGIVFSQGIVVAAVTAPGGTTGPATAAVVSLAFNQQPSQ